MKITKGLALLLFATGSGTAGEFRFDSVGARFGFSANHRTADLHQADAVASWNLPWAWEPADDWHLRNRLEFTVGGIFDRTADAFVTSLGHVLSLERDRFPLGLEIGFSPTLLSRKEVGHTDFGSLYQLTSHAGLNWDLGSHFRIGYRFQHMSNGGLTDHNPGLNLHVLSANYRF